MELPPKVRKKRLNPKQKLFVAKVAEGKTQTEAYKETYGHAESTAVVRVAASQMMAKPHIKEALEDTMARRNPELRETISEYLNNLIQDPDKRDSDKLNAIKFISDVFGWKKPTRSEHLHAKIDTSRFQLPGTVPKKDGDK